MLTFMTSCADALENSGMKRILLHIWVMSASQKGEHRATGKETERFIPLLQREAEKLLKKCDQTEQTPRSEHIVKDSTRNNQHPAQCYYCKTHPAQRNAVAHIELYGGAKHIYRGVRYQYMKLAVPRCPGCRKLHNWATISYITGGSLAILLAFGLAVGLGMLIPWLGIFSFLPLLLGILTLESGMNERVFRLPKHILAKLDISAYPPAQELFGQGWGLVPNPFQYAPTFGSNA